MVETGTIGDIYGINDDNYEIDSNVIVGKNNQKKITSALKSNNKVYENDQGNQYTKIVEGTWDTSRIEEFDKNIYLKVYDSHTINNLFDTLKKCILCKDITVYITENIPNKINIPPFVKIRNNSDNILTVNGKSILPGKNMEYGKKTSRKLKKMSKLKKIKKFSKKKWHM